MRTLFALAFVTACAARPAPAIPNTSVFHVEPAAALPGAVAAVQSLHYGVAMIGKDHVSTYITPLGFESASFVAIPPDEHGIVYGVNFTRPLRCALPCVTTLTVKPIVQGTAPPPGEIAAHTDRLIATLRDQARPDRRLLGMP